MGTWRIQDIGRTYQKSSQLMRSNIFPWDKNCIPRVRYRFYSCQRDTASIPRVRWLTCTCQVRTSIPRVRYRFYR